MSFKMRYDFVYLFYPDSLRNLWYGDRVAGYEFQIRLKNYRGHYLSCIDEFSLAVDGEAVPKDDLAFCLNGKAFGPDMLPLCNTEFWRVAQPATVRVMKPGGLSAGPHKLDVRLILRVPYLPLPGAREPHSYMPLDASESGELICAG